MSVDYETVLSLVNGYEVEKEQLYYVSFGFDRFLIKGTVKLPLVKILFGSKCGNASKMKVLKI